MILENARERTWAEIDLDALSDNFKQIKALVSPKTKILATVKANAYGHGAVPCAKTFLSAGADYLSVATVEEALELRAGGIDAPILILGYLSPDRAEELIAHNITACVYSKELAHALSRASQSLKKEVRIHIKVNTGMERLGFAANDVSGILEACSLPGILPEGIFTHLACADEENSESVHTQYECFMALLQELQNKGQKFPLRHILNSAGTFDFPEYELDMVRPGIALYGYYPSACIKNKTASLTPVLSLKTRVAALHTVEAGCGISYGHTFAPDTAIRVATLPVGYADGYARSLSGRAHVIAGEHLAKVVGRICMDQCMIDVSSVNTISVGDEIILLGKRGDQSITAEDLANISGTISYEILCAVGERIPRLFIKDGNITFVLTSSNLQIWK